MMMHYLSLILIGILISLPISLPFMLVACGFSISLAISVFSMICGIFYALYLEKESE